MITVCPDYPAIKELQDIVVSIQNYRQLSIAIPAPESGRAVSYRSHLVLHAYDCGKHILANRIIGIESKMTPRNLLGCAFSVG